MIESSLAFGTPPSAPDTGFKPWQTAMQSVRVRQQGTMRYDINDRTAGPIACFSKIMAREADLTAGTGHAYAPPGSLAEPAQTDIAYEPTKPEDSYEFADVIDMVNPMQHLPVIGTLYRKFTGDVIKPFSQIIGGTIFGGPVGAVASTVNVIVKDRTGRDVAENMLALTNLDSSPAPKQDDLTYIEPAAGNLPGTNVALANLAKAKYGQNNFAATKPSAYSWNT